MPALAKEREQYFISRIRGFIALDHRITNDEIRQRLATDGIELERHYIGKLVKKVYAERARRMDTITLNHALVAFAETMEEIVRRARDIADNPRRICTGSSRVDRVGRLSNADLPSTHRSFL